MIPKIIHYCWFGRGEKPQTMVRCIESWKKFCPDYEIREWNEDNFDVGCIAFVKAAYEAKKWAFVTDYARLRIIWENGGIYLDTDVELLKNLDDLLHLDAYMGFQGTEYINTGVGFGACKGTAMIRELMADYEGREFPDDPDKCEEIACPIINTRIFDAHGLVRNGKLQTVNGVTLFPCDYFDPKDSETYLLRTTENTYSIHHYDATWKNKNAKLKQKLIIAVVKIIGRDRFLWLKSKLKLNK